MSNHLPSAIALIVAGFIARGCSAPTNQERSPPPAAVRAAPPAPESPPIAGRASEAPRAEPAPDPHVTLQALQEYAETHAPLLRTERARVELGEAGVTAAAPLFPANPEINTTLGRQTTGGSQSPYSVTIQQQVEIAGERGLRIEAAERSRDLAQARSDAARWEIRWRIRAAFNEVLLAREKLLVADRTVEYSRELLDIARKRVDAGEDSPLSLLTPQADVAQARQLRLAAAQTYESSRLHLAELSGWPPNLRLEPVGNLRSTRRAKSGDALMVLAESVNPTLQVQSASVREAEALVRLREREAWPRPTVGLGYSREGDAQLNTVWSLSLSVPVPVWNRNEGERARSFAGLGIARSEESAARASLRARTMDAASAVNSSAERSSLYEAEILPALERNLELILRAYQVGELDITQVSLTRDRLLQSRRDALDSLSAYLNAAAELESLVGTEDWMAPEQP